MNYYWMYYDTSTGQLAPQQSTVSPMVSGQFDSVLIPPNHGVIGPYDDSGTNNMPADFQTAFENYMAWIYQNGQFEANPDLPNIQLSIAKAQVTSIIQAGYSQALQDGFTSSADGTSRVYALVGVDATGMTPAQKWSSILTLIASGQGQTSYTIKDLNGNTVTLTQSQFKQMASDGFAYMDYLQGKVWVKEAQLASCTTASQVQTIGWPNPNPPGVPTGLTATVGTAEVTLSWTANTDVTMIDGGGYNVYQNGTKVNTSLVTGTTYTVSGLTSGTKYSFSITAVDTDGQESAQCTAVSVTPN